jgi:hypothetical protein
MPPQAGRKVLFDSNIYIHAIRRGPARREYELLVNSLLFTYLSSVVSAELYLGALDSWGVRLVQGFVSRSEKVGRIVIRAMVPGMTREGFWRRLAGKSLNLNPSFLFYSTIF